MYSQVEQDLDHDLLTPKKKEDITQVFGIYRVNKKISLTAIQKIIEESYLDSIVPSSATVRHPATVPRHPAT